MNQITTKYEQINTLTELDSLLESGCTVKKPANLKTYYVYDGNDRIAWVSWLLLSKSQNLEIKKLLKNDSKRT